MNISDLIVLAIYFGMMSLLILIAVMNMRMKGRILFCSKWVFATDEERKRLDKRTCYRLSAANAFSVSILMVSNAIRIETGKNWIFFLGTGIGLLFAVSCTIIVSRNKKVKRRKRNNL